MKKFIPLLLCACFLIFATSCGTRSKEFTHRDLTLTLDSSFRVLSTEDACVSFASYPKMQTVTASFEEKESLRKIGYDPEMSRAEYGEILLEDLWADAEDADTVADIPKTSVKIRGNTVYFVFTRDADGISYTCLATLHESSNAFWTVTFAAPEEEFVAAEDALFEMAEKISFVKSSG